MKSAMSNGCIGNADAIAMEGCSNNIVNSFPDIDDMPRIDYSSIRGKKVLVSPTEEQFELLKRRLEERTQDSRGETIYEIGVAEGKFYKFE